MPSERASPWRHLSLWAWLLGGVLVVLAARHHVVTLGFEHPVAYGEGVTALWTTTDAQRYPTIEGTAAAVHNPYPPLGYLLAEPITAMTGDPFLGLRLLAVLGMAASAPRSFLTARKIACFVALTLMSSAELISTSDSSSKCRITKAVRSSSLKLPSA